MPFTLKQLLLASAIAMTVAVHGQEKEDPIDADYRRCLLKDTSVANICNCAYDAYARWEKEMNNAYKRLNKALRNEREREALKKAQAAWETYRDAQFSTYDLMFNLPGIRWCSVRQDGRIEMVRSRALELKEYEEALKHKSAK